MTSPGEKLAASFIAAVRGKGIPRWVKTSQPATDLETGVRYRTLWYRDDHYWSGTDNIAFCGRPLTVDPGVWQAIIEGVDGAHLAALYLSDRTSSLCRECANRLESPPIWAPVSRR